MNQDEIITLIKELIEKTTVPVSDISASVKETKNKSGATNTTWISVEVKEPQLFLGRGAEALLALNHLVRRIIENKNSEAQRDSASEIVIDINGFQKKRIESIHAVAYMMAERARYFKSKVEIDPMPAFERRVVHEFLANETDLTTESEGVGPSRRVIIKFIGEI